MGPALRALGIDFLDIHSRPVLQHAHDIRDIRLVRLRAEVNVRRALYDAKILVIGERLLHLLREKLPGKSLDLRGGRRPLLGGE